MKARIANIINAVILVILGLWGYLVSSSFTAFIPIIAGIVLMILTPALRSDNTTVINVTIALTILIIIGLIKPLAGALNRHDDVAMIRVVVMILSSIFALYFLIRKYSRRRRIL
jgi:CDP-diglyceride synthetase